MTASLAMYERPALVAATDRYWAAIRARLPGAPAALTRGRDLWEIWRDPGLWLAQTCSLPYRARLADAVALVGTPDYGLDGCPPGHYRSLFVVRRGESARLEDHAGRRLAYNEALSQSGWAGPIRHLAARGIRPGALVETGAHLASARAVAEGRADLAGLDALSHRLLVEHDPDIASALVVIDATEPAPGLPYITAPHRDPGRIADAVADAIASLDPADRAALHLRGLVRIEPEVYLAMPIPPSPADLPVFST